MLPMIMHESERVHLSFTNYTCSDRVYATALDKVGKFLFRSCSLFQKYLTACACCIRNVSICCFRCAFSPSHSGSCATAGTFGTPAAGSPSAGSPSASFPDSPRSGLIPDPGFLAEASGRVSLRAPLLVGLLVPASRAAAAAAASPSKLGRFVFQAWPRGTRRTTPFISSAMHSGQRDLTR